MERVVLPVCIFLFLGNIFPLHETLIIHSSHELDGSIVHQRVERGLHSDTWPKLQARATAGESDDSMAVASDAVNDFWRTFGQSLSENDEAVGNIVENFPNQPANQLTANEPVVVTNDREETDDEVLEIVVGDKDEHEANSPQFRYQELTEHGVASSNPTVGHSKIPLNSGEILPEPYPMPAPIAEGSFQSSSSYFPPAPPPQPAGPIYVITSPSSPSLPTRYVPQVLPTTSQYPGLRPYPYGTGAVSDNSAKPVLLSKYPSMNLPPGSQPQNPIYVQYVNQQSPYSLLKPYSYLPTAPVAAGQLNRRGPEQVHSPNVVYAYSYPPSRPASASVAYAG